MESQIHGSDTTFSRVGKGASRREGGAGEKRRISYEQFLSCILHYHLDAHRESLSSLRELFDLCDSDGDGLLSPSEMWLCARGLRQVETQKEREMERLKLQKRIAVEADINDTHGRYAADSVERDRSDAPYDMDSSRERKYVSVRSPCGVFQRMIDAGYKSSSSEHLAATGMSRNRRELFSASEYPIPPTSSSYSTSSDDFSRQSGHEEVKAEEEEEEEEEGKNIFLSSLRDAVPCRNNFHDTKFSFSTAVHLFQKLFKCDPLT